MNKTIRIAIAEDHEIVRQGLVQLLNKSDNITIVSDVPNGALLLNELRIHSVDIVLMDLNMPVMGGKETLKLIKERYPSIKVIILSMNYTDTFIIESVSAGARAFLPKETDVSILFDAINAVYTQGYYFDDKVSKALLFQVMENKDIKPEFSDIPLSKREKEIIKCICNGHTNKEIAEKLFLSIRTVEVHRKHIAQKTHSTNIAGVVIYAIKNGLYQI